MVLFFFCCNPSDFGGLLQFCQLPCNPTNCLAILKIALQFLIACAISMQSVLICLIVQGFGPGLWSYVIQWANLCNFWCNQCNLSELPQDYQKSGIQLQSAGLQNTKASIARGLRRSRRSFFGDCGESRVLQGTPKHMSRPALYSGLRLDQQPLG